MQQLSWTDDMMLRAERPETPMQIQMLLIYDPATAPGGKVTFKGILEEIDARPAAARAKGLKDRYPFKADLDAEARRNLFRHVAA